MNKESILEMSRKENNNKDLVEKQAENKSAVIAGIVTLIVVLVFFGAEIMCKGVQNYGFFAIIAIYEAVLFGYKGILQKSKINLVAGICWLLTFVAASASYISYLVSTSAIL